MAAENGGTDRHRLARLVVVGSFLTIFLLVAALLSIGQLGSPSAANLAEKTFNVILPVLAGWVGTVLAFYFSAQIQEATNKTLDTAIGHVVGQSKSSKSVSEIMIPLGNIKGLKNLGKDQPDADIKFEEISKLFKDPQAPITRMIITKEGKFHYVIHASLVDKYIAAASAPPADDAKPAPPPDSLANFVAYGDYKIQMTMLVAFVARDATLDQANAALNATRGAQDIIVTGDGAPASPMLGWITDVDLTSALAAG